MAETASERIRIEAPPPRVYEIAADFERYPEWAKDVKQVKVLERDDEGRGLRVEYRAAALGRSTRYVLEYDYGEAPAAFSWKLVEGDMLRQLDGRYGFVPDGDGTRVSYELTADPSIPLPGFIKRRAASKIIGTALKELKREAERPATGE
ncbi:MAG: SRPBCC family protein [Actinomycetota bacterium]